MTRTSSKGFSLLELLIVMFIISVGFTAVFSLLTKSIVVGFQVENELVAISLAAEAIEVIINIRNSNWLEDPPCAYDDFNGDCVSDTFPIINTNVTSTSIAISDTSDTLYLENIAGNQFYTHNATGTQPTIFSRRVEMSRAVDAGGVSYIEVKSIVGWTQFGLPKQVELIDHLYDWKPQ